MKGFMKLVLGFVGITIALLMTANVIMPTIYTANQTGWDAGSKAIWGILGIVAVASIIGVMFV